MRIFLFIGIKSFPFQPEPFDQNFLSCKDWRWLSQLYLHPR